jgi:hypothetical protein
LAHIFLIDFAVSSVFKLHLPKRVPLLVHVAVHFRKEANVIIDEPERAADGIFGIFFLFTSCRWPPAILEKKKKYFVM